MRALGQKQSSLAVFAETPYPDGCEWNYTKDPINFELRIAVIFYNNL